MSSLQRRRPIDSEEALMSKELETLLVRLRQEQEARAKLASLSGKGRDRIRNDQDLDIAMRYMTEVEMDKSMTEEQWSLAHPEDYERLKQIAGTTPAPGAKEDGTG
jgi:hypothetical protein